MNTKWKRKNGEKIEIKHARVYEVMPFKAMISHILTADASTKESLNRH